MESIHTGIAQAEGIITQAESLPALRHYVLLTRQLIMSQTDENAVIISYQNSLLANNFVSQEEDENMIQTQLIFSRHSRIEPSDISSIVLRSFTETNEYILSTGKQCLVNQEEIEDSISQFVPSRKSHGLEK